MALDQDQAMDMGPEIHHMQIITYTNQNRGEINHHKKSNMKARKKIVVLNLNLRTPRPLPHLKLNYILTITTLVS